MSIDLSEAIARKRATLNADDLIAGRARSPLQPSDAHRRGSAGRHPLCRRRRQALQTIASPCAECLSAHGAQTGRSTSAKSTTLFLDDQVRFGGAAVGGIRISHLSHIEKSITMALTATRATKKAYLVQVLAAPGVGTGSLHG